MRIIRIQIDCHVSKYSLTYTHDASVGICERHLNANENDSHSAIMGTQPSWAHSHHGHSAIMGTQRAPHVSKYSLTYNHAGCVGIC